MRYHTYQLQNGLRIIHLPVESPVSYCGFAVNAGTRDERDDEHGMAHLVEHMLFKGTTKRKAWHILNRMEVVGGELNAYTTKEETFVYSVFLAEHFNRSVELLTDIVFHSSFPQKELEKEKEVILDEINSYEDSPSELIYDEFENQIFAGHQLGHHILGNQESIERYTPEDGLSFLHRFYMPEQMVFFSMGRQPFKQLVKTLERLTGALNLAANSGNSARIAPSEYKVSSNRMDKDTHQAHVLIGNRAYSMYDEKRMALFVLNNLLGGPGMNSRLNLMLRERHGLVYTIESNITSYTDTGMASIYFGTDPKHLEKALQLVKKVLRELQEKKLSTSQMAVVKRQIIAQMAISRDNREGLFLGLGKNYLHHGSYSSLEEIAGKIDVLTAEDLRNTANEVFIPEQLSYLIYC
ncbi:pitrilysin family protein [Parabacteroides sp. PF5-9]|uniref:M16 family metallopeptidase n=1 Tax=Parabacteroides sp. PF5-9 TaxID=1742404 RepID=UPI0024771DBE|nr:pitrilysin family protein [Parabacteroides sp. PF5-9]